MSELENSYVLKGKISGIQAIDKTLSKEGAAADAKATGDAIAALEEGISGEISGAVFAHIESKSNPHDVTAAQVGARPNTWMPTASDVGALAPSYIMHGTSNGDFNEKRQVGIYWCQLDACTNTPPKEKTSGYGWLEVVTPFEGMPTDVFQRFTSYENHRVFERSSVNGWSNWVEAHPKIGLGHVNTSVDINDPSSVLGGNYVGWFQGSATNNPFPGDFLWIEGASIDNDTVSIQTIHRYSGKNVARRYWVNGAWTALEFENPPMEDKKEYRTVKRWSSGEAVYMMKIDLGTLPNAGVKTLTGLFGATAIVNIYGYARNSSNANEAYNIVIPSDKVGIGGYPASGSLEIITHTDCSGYSGFIIVEYIK